MSRDPKKRYGPSVAKERFVAGRLVLVPGRNLVGLVSFSDEGVLELDEEVEVGEEGSGSDLSDLHGGEVAFDSTGEGPTHGSKEVVGVHPGVNEAVEDTEDCRRPSDVRQEVNKKKVSNVCQSRCWQGAKLTPNRLTW